MKKKVNWRVYERDHIYPQSIAAYLDLIKINPSAKYPYIAKYYEVMSYTGDYFWWARDLDKLEVQFRRWIKNWLKHPAKYRRFLKNFGKSHREIKRILPGLKAKTNQIVNISNCQLYDIYSRAKKVLLNSFLFSEYSVDLFDDFFNQIFLEKISQVSKIDLDPTDLQKLLRPARSSESLLYRKRLLELSCSKGVDYSILSKVSERFSWIMMSWDGSNEITSQKVQQEISVLKKKSVSQRKKELSEIRKFTRVIKTQRRAIVKKYKLPLKKLIFYFNLLDTFIVLHDWRKEAQMRGNQVIFRVLKEISKRYKIRFYDLLWYFNSEIEKLCLKGRKVTQAVIKKRQTGLTWVIRGGKISQYQSKEARRVLTKLILSVQRAKQVSEVSGIPASHGQAKGKAYVVKSAKEAQKVLKRGGILITSMTTVDYLPAMRRASAIVTDDGGLTCHAAIVSRELKIPCVVGTKIATQVFKNGDRIKVDATHGIIKKI